MFNHNENISTLRLGERAKRIKNKPKINKEVTVAELKIEIENLEKIIQRGNKRVLQLEQFIEKNNLRVPAEDDFSFMKEATKLMESLTNLDMINDENDNSIINEEIKFDNHDLNYHHMNRGAATPEKRMRDFNNENSFGFGKLNKLS